ncbi:MAG: 50S ribosomal protein L4 [Deltaproteobacteria bacterium]|nr:MAG: 50S ribosomal protein L4 [Deltaproteobacteria bacterium]
MAKIEIIDKGKNVVEEREVSPAIFQQEVKPHLLHTVVVAQLAARRRGTASTKTRSEVSGGGRKPWRQKGTGRARAGSIRSPLWRGGGIVFGPKPRDYSIKVNKKVRRKALQNALAMKFQEGNLIVLDSIDLPSHRTKDFLAFAESVGITDALIVDVEPSRELLLGSRNVQSVKVLPQKALNVYDIMCYEQLVLTKAALEKIEEVLGQ